MIDDRKLQQLRNEGHDDVADALVQLICERNAALADAQRFRWLRDSPKSRKWEVTNCALRAHPMSFRGSPLDAAIDRAMAASK